MTGKFVSVHAFRLLLVAIMAAGIAAFGIHPGTGEQNPDDELQLKINETVEGIWERSDGAVSRGDADRAWLWGPSPISTSTEFYPESPNGSRTLVYYNKGRLDILDPNVSSADDWYAVGGLLVQEMLAGYIQFGDTFFVERERPNVPLTGDFNQAQPVTYATLAPFTSAWGEEGSDGFASGGERRVGERTGETVMAFLGGDGRLIPNAVLDSGVRFAGYDETTGHNIADIFADWNAAQPYHELYLLGHPISEPYWIDTVVNGQTQTILIQAFQRRVLTYNVNNPAGWQVESTNVGDHYRAWRGLPDITDPEYMQLAAGVPFGEELTGAALAWDVDPFMLAAISQVASDGDPQKYGANGGRGLLAVNPALHEVPAQELLIDPALNADNGARSLAFWIPDGVADFDWRGVLANYYTHGEVDWSNELMDRFVSDVLETYGQLKEQYPRLASEPALDPAEQGVWGGVLDRGPAAFYDPSYTTPWWERTQNLYASIGVIAPHYEPDPNGYYCVRPGYVPGERLRLRANGVTITCTVGDMVADHDLHNWLLVSNWSVELSWSAFTALGLQNHNYVEVDYPGAWAKRPPPIPPPASTATEPPAKTPEPVDNSEPQEPAPTPPVSALPANPPEATPEATEPPPAAPDPTATPEPDPPAEGEPTPPPTT